MQPISLPSTARALVAVASLIAMSACGRSAADADATTGAPPLAVTTAVAAIAEVPEPLEAGGVVAAGTTAVVTSRLVAPIAEVRVSAGDRVRAGQVLVVLDDGAFGAQAEQARASVVAAEQTLLGARAEHAAAAADRTAADAWHARIAALHARQAATPHELDEAEARRASAAARADGAEARIEQASSLLAAARATADAARITHGFAVIAAPFAGLVVERMADPGNLASPGVPLLRLETEDAPHVEARVDEARAGLLASGDRVEVLFDSSHAPVEGVVTEISRAVAADQRAFTVEISLPRGHAVRTGTFARVRFPGPVREALLVPAGGVRWQGQIATAFVVSDGIAQLRLLQTGVARHGHVEVLAGLEPGEVLVVDPPSALADGRPVSAAEARPGADR